MLASASHRFLIKNSGASSEVPLFFVKRGTKAVPLSNKSKKTPIQNVCIFKRPDSRRPYTPDYIPHKFSKLLKQHNLPHIRFHELRQCSDRYGVVAGGCAGVVGSLGYPNDRKHLFPFGYYPKMLHCVGDFRELQAIKS